MVCFRIKDWDKHFENNRTRELKYLDWVPIPNKMDGDGYTELVDHPDGAAHLGAWVAIVEVASRCDVRGTLMRDGDRPHDSASLSRQTRLPKQVFDEVIPRLILIGWIESQYIYSKVVKEDSKTISQDNAEIPHDHAEKRLRNGTERNGNNTPAVAAETLRKTPTGPHAEFIDHFCDLWQKSYGEKYPFKGGLDGKKASEILAAVQGDLPKAKRLAAAFLAEKSDFLAGHSLSTLASGSQLPRFLAKSHNGGNGTRPHSVGRGPALREDN